VTEKGRTIQLQQGVVTDLIAHLAGLPEREKRPADPVNLPEVFRTKEYMAEIQGALEKGYTFEDLAEIFSEKCGVAVSARQIKYHRTREKNKGMETRSGKKPRGASTPKRRASPANPPQKDPVENTGRNTAAAERSSKTSEIVSGSDAATGVKAGTFSIEMNTEEI
jgi:hypothetical protein